MDRKCICACTIIILLSRHFDTRAQDEGPQNFAVWSGIEWYLPFQEDSRWGLFAEGYIKRVNFLPATFL